MEDDRETGHSIHNGFQNIKPQLRVCTWLELVGTVGSTHGDGQRIAAGSGNKFSHLFRFGISSLICGYIDIIFHTGKGAQLRLNHDTMIVSIFHDFSGNCNILLKRF